jgi:hypothetical protein
MHLSILEHPDPIALADRVSDLLGTSALLIDDPDAVRAFRGDARWTLSLEAALDLMDVARSDSADLTSGSFVIHARRHGERSMAWLAEAANVAPAMPDVAGAVFAP